MNSLYVAWQQPESKEWIPVGRLDRIDGKYRFLYTRGVHRARDFQPFSRMSQIDAIYEAESLFPLFANRLVNRSRPEFRDYIRWMGLSDTADDPMSILALTGGIRGTDSIELFQPPSITPEGRYQLDFFVRSLAFLPKHAIEAIETLTPGSPLFLMHDIQNSFDPYALAIRTERPIFMVGYCPKYYVKDLSELLGYPDGDLKVEVKSVNIDAPLNMRLLCSISACQPPNAKSFCVDIDFEPVSNSVPSTWEGLTASIEQAIGN